MMDFDGFMLLMQQDRTKFDEWWKKSENMSLVKSKESMEETLAYYAKKYLEYEKVEAESPTKDATLQLAKYAYFHGLAVYTIHSCVNYLRKLEKEHYALKKSVRNKAKTKRRKPVLK